MNDTQLPRMQCSLVFAPPVQGGRAQGPPDLSSGQYRPHVIVDYIANPTDFDYRGVVFVAGPQHPRFGEVVTSEFICAYHPGVDYSVLEAGVYFRVVEGSRIVAHGVALRGPPSASALRTRE